MAQLVEHYLREVGAACSNHVTPIVKNRSVERFFDVIGNFLEIPIASKCSAMDATGAHLYMQAKVCLHQRAKSGFATLCSFDGILCR